MFQWHPAVSQRHCRRSRATSLSGVFYSSGLIELWLCVFRFYLFIWTFISFTLNPGSDSSIYLFLGGLYVSKLQKQFSSLFFNPLFQSQSTDADRTLKSTQKTKQVVTLMMPAAGNCSRVTPENTITILSLFYRNLSNFRTLSHQVKYLLKMINSSPGKEHASFRLLRCESIQ